MSFCFWNGKGLIKVLIFVAINWWEDRKYEQSEHIRNVATLIWPLSAPEKLAKWYNFTDANKYSGDSGSRLLDH